MKMKTVCEMTGLTDRAVRLYIQEKLVLPVITENYLGRKTLDFRQEDVQQLLDIAVLHKFGFSIAQIRAIQLSPESAGVVLEDARAQTEAMAERQQSILAALGRVHIEGGCTVETLADALRSADTADLPVKDDAGPGYIKMVLTLLLLCVAVIVGVLTAVLLTDMTVFYFRSGALALTGEGLKAVFSRSGVYLAWLLIGAGLLIPLGYYAGILWRYGRNSRKPEIHTRAVVVDKRQTADAVVLSSFYARNGGMIGRLVFREADGTVLELTAPERDYYTMAIGTRGELVYQGSKMVCFTPDVK